MLRSAARRVSRQSQAIRSISSSRANLAVPATVTHANKSGLLSWLLGDKPATNVPPLYEPLPSVKLPPTLPDDQGVPPTEVTTLCNGLKIASENTPGPTATVGLYIEAGSVHETPRTLGSVHILERMAFKSTMNRSHFRLVREVEAIGANIMASASREQMAYTGDVIKTHLPQILELLVDSVINPVFYEWELKEQLSKVKGELADLANNPQSLLMEALHTAGYQGALAQPLIVTEAMLPYINSDRLGGFVEENYFAPRMVLAASGVDHSELVKLAEPLLKNIPQPSEKYTSPKSAYTGGDFRAVADTSKTNIAIAFEAIGGWRDEKNSIALTVLQTLLGGGGSFSAGGPGKGMHSRLYTSVLNRYTEVHNISAFSSIYNDTGLFGIHGTVDYNHASNLGYIICNELKRLLEAGSVTETELLRAKNSTISAVLMNLESRVVVTEDIGRQILTYGHRKPVQGFVDIVNSLTIQDIQSVARKLLNTPMTMASYGDLSYVPKYEELCETIKK